MLDETRPMYVKDDNLFYSGYRFWPCTKPASRPNCLTGIVDGLTGWVEIHKTKLENRQERPVLDETKPMRVKADRTYARKRFWPTDKQCADPDSLAGIVEDIGIWHILHKDDLENIPETILEERSFDIYRGSIRESVSVLQRPGTGYLGTAKVAFCYNPETKKVWTENIEEVS